MDADLHLNDLQCFVLVHDLRSVSRAADSLDTTQSVISERIQRLERFAGARLFLRVPHGIVPNRQGERLYEQVKQLLSHVAELEAAVRAD